MEKGYPANIIEDIKIARQEMREYGSCKAMEGKDVLEYANRHLYNQTYVNALELKYKEGLSVGEIADRMGVSMGTANKYISNGLAEIGYRMDILFSVGFENVTIYDSIRALTSCDYRYLVELEISDFKTISDLLTVSKWKTIRSIPSRAIISLENEAQRLRNRNIREGKIKSSTAGITRGVEEENKERVEGNTVGSVEKVTGGRPKEGSLQENKQDLGTGDSFSKSVESEMTDSRPLFVVVQDYGDVVYGFEVSKRSDSCVCGVVPRSSLVGYRVVSIDSDVHSVLAGDVALRSLRIMSKKPKLMSKLRDQGIQTLGDLSTITRKDFVTLDGASSFADVVEREMRYRGLGSFRVPEPVVSSDSVTSVGSVDVVALSDEALPFSFRCWASSRLDGGAVDDPELLQLYNEYLYGLDRIHDIYVLENLCRQYSDVPIGVIHIIEGFHKNPVFYKNQLSDRWVSILLSLYIREYSDGFAEGWKKDLFSQTCMTYIDKFEQLDVPNMFYFVQDVEWEIGSRKLAYIRKYYLAESELFIRKPEGGSYVDDRNKLRGLCNSQCSVAISSSMYDIIDSMCRRLGVSYEYAVSGLSNVTSFKELRLLCEYFNFNYKGMTMFLKEHPDFLKVMEVA